MIWVIAGIIGLMVLGTYCLCRVASDADDDTDRILYGDKHD